MSFDYSTVKSELAKLENRVDVWNYRENYLKEHRKDMSMSQDAAFRQLCSQRDAVLVARQWGFGKEQHE